VAQQVRRLRDVAAVDVARCSSRSILVRGENYDRAVRVAQGYRVNAISRMMPITTTDGIPADERQKIDAAVPRQALVKPRSARKLLISTSVRPAASTTRRSRTAI
jgi:hypothetical protein